MSSLSCPVQSPNLYRERYPQKTPFFQIIKKWYKTWEKTQEQIPHYVKKTFAEYLKCGDPHYGFGHAHCCTCHQDFILPFSCKGRGLCPSCNQRSMVETAAHIIENVIPIVPVRQWVITFPFRIRHFLKTDAILQDVLHIVADEVRKRIIICSQSQSVIPNGQFGAVTFIQRFGNKLNYHPHFHMVVADGVFNNIEDRLQFHEALITLDDIADTQELICKRVLKLFKKRNLLEHDIIESMLAAENKGFSLDAKVRIEEWDRDGLERLIRYCARPSFTSENVRWNGLLVMYRLPKPGRNGETTMNLCPLDFIGKLADLIPPPRRHRIHYQGAFAPNAPLRQKVVANANQRPQSMVPPSVQQTAHKTAKISFTWAKLIARIYEVDPLVCPCGNEIKIRAIITNPLDIQRILLRMGWKFEPAKFETEIKVDEGLDDRDYSHLFPGTMDGFPPTDIADSFSEEGPDPPNLWANSDLHHESYYDQPHLEYSDSSFDNNEQIDQAHWEEPYIVQE